MAGGVVRLDARRDPRWDAFVSAHPHGRLCDTSAWLEVLERTFGYEPVTLAHEVDGRLHGILALCRIRSRLTGSRLVSLPFSGPAGPIGDPPAVACLLAEARRLMTALGCGHLNIRTQDRHPAGAFDGFTSVAPFVSSHVLLDKDPAEVWRRIPIRSVRSEIRIGRSRGLTWRIADSKDDLGTFYRLFTETSRKHGIPPQPRRMFDLMWELLHPGRVLHLFLVALDGRVVTALLCFAFRDVMTAGFVGTDYRELRLHPVKVADWAALSWACREGYRVFDFLQSHVQNHGLRWYKRSFGAVEVPVAYHYYPGTDPTSRLRETLIGRSSPIAAGVKAVVRRLPSPGFRLLGELTYRHMG
jgi:CelD/BcsL family acetyltransferase involved in cellulose biosynthesis